MDLRHLRYFVAVAEVGNVSRAAGKLHVAQPALSRQIKDLERELGVPLLRRHAKGVALTPAGAALARGATGILTELAGALQRADAAAAGRRGRVVLGAVRAAFGHGFPGALQERIRRDHPAIELIARDLDPPDIWDELEDGAIDAALVIDPARPALLAQPLWSEIVDVAILPMGHPLAHRRAISLPDLHSLPFLCAARSLPPGVLDLILQRLRESDLRSPILAIDGDMRSVHMAVAAGRGWTLITRSRRAATPDGTTPVTVTGLDLNLVFCIVWRRAERRQVMRTVLEAAFDIARAQLRTALPPGPPLPPPAAAARRALPATVPMALEVRHLRALLAVMAAQTIGRAAQRLGLTQPALSRQIKELEHAVGLSLLERAARGVTMTAAGASLAGDCPALLLAVKQLAQDTQQAKRGMEGQCVIGAVATVVTSSLLTQTLSACAAKLPHIRIVIQEIATPLQPAALTRGDIDLGLAHAFPGSPPQKGITRTQVMEDRLCLAMLPATHPLARRRRLSARELADVPFLFMARDFHPGFYDRLYGALKDLGLQPRVEATYEGLQAVWAMAAQGKGWCIGWESQLRHPPLGTVGRRIEGLNLPWGVDLLSRTAERSDTVRAVTKELFAAARRPKHRKGAA